MPAQRRELVIAWDRIETARAAAARGACDDVRTLRTQVEARHDRGLRIAIETDEQIASCLGPSDAVCFADHELTVCRPSLASCDAARAMLPVGAEPGPCAAR